jgi:CRP-like cAMP-binding protein
MAFASQRVTFKAGQSLFEHGDEGDAAYIIVEGDADILVDTPAGPLTVAKVEKNDIVGEIAILCDVPRTATVMATSELTTLRITQDLFFRMVTDFPEMGVEVMRVLAHRLEQTTMQLRKAQSGAG